MELHTIRPAKGSVHLSKRKGRGQGSGKGGTSTKGHKGAKSRAGARSKPNYEGGQMPIQMRLPKRGFKNVNRKEYIGINVSRLEEIANKYQSKSIDKEFLYKNGIIKKRDLVKILGSGDINVKLEVTVDAVSSSAKEKIEKQGGKVNLV